MRRTVLLALAPLVALSLVTAGGVNASQPQIPLDMSSAFDKDCTQERAAEIVTGNCQSSTFAESYIKEEFVSGTVNLRKQTFVIGDTALIALNAANGAGQVVTAPGKAGYAYLQVLITFVGNGEGKKKGGPATITYTDKSTAKVPLTSFNWDHGGGAPAWTSPKQGLLHLPTGGSNSQLFIEQLELDPRKAVASIKLPEFDGLRIFAMTLSNTSSVVSGPVFR